MRFMILRKADQNTEAGALPSEKLLAAMGQYMEEMVKAGILLAGEGLRPTSDGVRVKFSHGKPSVTDGPFAEAKELVAGWSLIQVDSLEEANGSSGGPQRMGTGKWRSRSDGCMRQKTSDPSLPRPSGNRRNVFALRYPARSSADGTHHLQL